MNFCGVQSQILDDSSKLPGSSSVRFHCGTCIKTTSDDDVEITAAVDRLSIMESSDDEEEYDEEELQRNVNGEARTEPVKAALDSIQQKLEETTSSENQVNAGISIVVGDVTPSTAGTYGNLETDSSPDHKWSPSPNMLNPLITSWSEQPDITKNESSKLFCPVLDASPSLAKLMQRLQEGFHVRLTGGSSVGCLEGEDNVWLYLHDDRSRLCIETDASENREEKKNEVGFWIELPLHDVLRLEIGGTNRSPRGFSLVIEKESGRLAYYDFEASSAIDREVIVSAIMLLLDQTHNPQYDQDDNLEWRDGTLDQPIPCSPSLDRPSSFGGSVEQQPILCSPSLEREHLRKSQLSPMNRTQIHNSDEARETETSLVTHFEDSAETNTVRSGSTWSRRDYPTMNFQFKNSDIEESRIDFKPSASSTHPGLIAANSAHTTTGVWCPADVCTYALNDIADTCTGIFDLKRQDAVTPFGCDQQVIVEEFIASALGAPNAVYTYVTDGDIWNIQSSISVSDAKETPVARNRASLLNAQAARLRSLRNEMTFAAALKQSKEKMHFVKTVQSFDDAYTRMGGSRRLKATTKAANQLHSSPLLRSIVERMTMHDPNGDFLEDKEECVVYYDSDPEDNRQRTSQFGPRRAVAEKVNRKIETEGTHIRSLSGVGFDNIGSTKKISKKLDEETIVEIVHAMNHETFTLMWHPTQSKPHPNRSPICVHVWIESGIYLNDGTFLLPKLTWSKASEDNATQKQSALEKIDLLDVCRIRPTTVIERSMHPFAIAGKSFYVETQEGIFLFQAQSTEERDRIVYGLKLVIARLASLLMLRDIRAAEEFFGAMQNTVPGGPSWTRQRETDSTSGNNATTSSETVYHSNRL